MKQEKFNNNCKLNAKRFWSYIRSKSNMVTLIGDIEVKLNDQDVIIENDDKKAQIFSDYFSSMFAEELLTNIPNITLKNCFHKYTLINFSESQILDKLNQLNCTKSPGPDRIHPRILYELREYIAYPLKLIFEESSKQKELPIDWRSANITALFKKGLKNDVSNYRPVSLTSIVYKLI